MDKYFKKLKGKRVRQFLTNSRFIIVSVGLFSISLGVMMTVAYWINFSNRPFILVGDQINLQSANININPPTAQAQEIPKQSVIVTRDIPAPTFTGEGVLAIDYDTNQILYQKNIHKRLSPASTTKVMTGLVAVDQFQQGDTLTVMPEDMVGGSTMGLNVGEKLSFRGLLYGMLLNSGNDAAYTVASNYPGGLPAFIVAMNSRVQQLNLTDTHFQNPAGLDDPNHYSSAYDLSVIAKAAVEHPSLARVVATRETEVTTLDKSKLHELKNVNQLLNEPGVMGIKTGFTEIAGENLVGLVERDGHKVITVILKSNDRFGETKALMDWVYKNYSWTTQ